MPLTSLTKTLNVLLQGLVGVVMIAYLFRAFPTDPITKALGQAGAAGATMLILGGTAFCLLVGIAVDRFGERFILPLIERAAETGRPRLFFKLTRAVAQQTAFCVFRARAVEKIRKSVWSDPNIDTPGHRVFRTTVEVIVFNSGRKEVLDWIVEHYVLSRLSSGFVILMCVALPALFQQPPSAIPILSIVTIWAAVFYGVLMTAVDQCLYSYTAMLGEVLAILGKEPVFPNSEQPSPKVAKAR